jgi:hypothetical protein
MNANTENGPSERDRIVAEIRHIATPDSSFEYGHQFRREGDDSVCRCGFRLSPMIECERARALWGKLEVK